MSVLNIDSRAPVGAGLGDLEDRLKGMSMQDLAKLNQNLSKELSSMANDKDGRDQLQYINDVLVESADSINGYRLDRSNGKR